MIKTTLLLFALSAPSIACSISGPKQIILSEKKSISEAGLDLKECDSSKEQRILNFINDFKGTLTDRIVKLEIGSGIQLSSNIQITSLESFLNNKLSIPKDWKFINSSFTGQTSGFLKTDKNDVLNVQCSNCINPGKKNILIESYNPISGRTSRNWVSTELSVKSLALVASKNFNIDYQSLNPSEFELKEVYTTSPDKIFTQKDRLVFYKLNRPKAKGEVLIFQDISPVNLVKMGTPVNVVLIHNGIKISGNAIAGQSGKIGETIRLKNTKTNKTIVGKIINFNKVEVNL